MIAMLKSGLGKRSFLPLATLMGFIGIADTAFMLPVISAYAKFLGADEALAGLIAGLYSVVAILASFVMGISVDILGRRRALLLAFLSDSIMVYAYSLVTNPAQLYIVRALHAIGGSLTFPAIIAFVGDVKADSLGRSFALYWMGVGSSIAIGSIISGLITSILGFKAVFQVLSIIMMIGLFLSFLIPETLEKSSKPKRIFIEIKKSIGWLLSSYVSIYALYYVFGVITGILSLTLMNVLGIREEAVRITGFYIGLSTTISIALFYLFGAITDKKGPRIPAIVGFISLMLSQIILAFNLAWNFILLSSIALGIAMSAILTLSTVVASSTSQSSRGTSIGFQQTMNILGVATGAPISGLILKTVGPQAPYLIGAFVQILALIIILLSLRNYVKLPKQTI
ncbi:MAG: MFS transporter [archaeon]|nr:MFS transporter [archaeon]